MAATLVPRVERILLIPNWSGGSVASKTYDELLPERLLFWPRLSSVLAPCASADATLDKLLLGAGLADGTTLVSTLHTRVSSSAMGT